MQACTKKVYTSPNTCTQEHAHLNLVPISRPLKHIHSYRSANVDFDRKIDSRKEESSTRLRQIKHLISKDIMSVKTRCTHNCRVYH